jgi:AcrR family transcriptional regulator
MKVKPELRIVSMAKGCGPDPGTVSCKKNAAERVFETARELFYRRGVRAVGVDEIVCQAGVTKPSLYRAFASKDELVAACLEESGREARAALEALLDNAPPDPRKKLSVVVRFYADRIAQPDFRGCPMSNTAVEFPEPGHPGREVLEFCKTQMRAMIAGLTRELPVREPDGLADGLVLIIEGAMASHHIYGSQGPSAAMVATAEALIDRHMEGVPA